MIKKIINHTHIVTKRKNIMEANLLYQKIQNLIASTVHKNKASRDDEADGGI